jgi:hypothetical protein
MSHANSAPYLPFVMSSRSQSLQESAASKLTAPTQPKLCEPCQAFLRGDRELYGDDDDDPTLDDGCSEHVHHPTAKSFQEAIELPCDICVLAHAAFGQFQGNYVKRL